MISELPAHKFTLWYLSPAQEWASQALPIGNAYIGGMIYGGISKEQIQYNEKTLWAGGPGAWSHYNGGNRTGAADYLPHIREKIARKEFDAAECLMSNYMLGDPTAYGSYQAFGNIYLDYSRDIIDSNATLYRRELDIEDGIARVQFEHDGAVYRREYFCSYPDRVMAIRLTSDRPNNLNIDITADCSQSVHTIAAETATKTIRTTGHVHDNHMGFESLISVICESGNIEALPSGLRISHADVITIIMTAATEYVNEYPTYTGGNPHATVEHIMAKAVLTPYETLLHNHQQDYRSLFHRVTIDLNEEVPPIPTDQLVKNYGSAYDKSLEALMFQYGRYLLISSSRPGSLPANLQGVWNETNSPPWTCDYHFDVNLQMNYFSSEVTNLTECSDPLVDYIASLRKPGRVTAEMHFGVKGGGWIVNPMNNPFGFTAPGWDSYWGWAPFNAAWICQNLWDKYKFNGDKDYLRNHIYPTIREQALFWLEWLVEDEDGYLVSSPSVSPEHLPISDGPTSDEAMCYELLSDVIEASEILDTDHALREQMILAHGKLLPLKIGSWGQLQEWKYDWDNPKDNHRHVSHLATIYQGERINPYDTPELANAAKVSLAARDAMDGDVKGWSVAERMGIWARLLEPERAYQQLQYLIGNRIFENLFTITDVFQIEANLGTPGLMSEMLVQSHLRNIHLLPALPAAWRNGQVTGLCARGGFVVDIAWENGELKSAVVTSRLGETCTVKNPLFAQRFTLTSTAANEHVPTSKTGDTITFPTEKDHSYRIMC